MLHSTLPRAFITPGLKYLGGYYGEDVTGYPSLSEYQPPTFDESYASPSNQHVFPTWHTVQRSASPSPLDLSLKPRIDEDHLSRNRSRFYRLTDEDEEVIEDEGVKKRIEKEREMIIEIGKKQGRNEESDNLNNGGYDPSSLQDLNQIERGSPGSRYVNKIIISPDNSGIQPMYNAAMMTPQHHLQGINAPMTPPSTPSPPQCPRKRPREESTDVVSPVGGIRVSPIGIINSIPQEKDTTTTTTITSQSQRPKKKHARRLKFDEDTSSPVSGTVILGPDEAVVTGDIDPAFNVVEVTEEARAELAKIENRLGPYQCRLCRQLHDDAFQLAQHRCSRIAHVEYRCPECDKRFSCPANLASHRRWHKPRAQQAEGSSCPAGTPATEFSCSRCEAKFSRQAALRKHVASQHPEIVNVNGGRTSTGSSGSGSETQGSTATAVSNGNVEHIIATNLALSSGNIDIP